MYPFFDFSFLPIIYTFGLTITICFFMFTWMLKKMSAKLSFDFIIFKKNIFWFFISVFVFSRLFYVIGKWHDLKYIKSPMEFFIMNDYNFSLAGAIFGFFLVLFITLRIRKEKLENFFDGIVISMFFSLFVGYIGAFFGGQVYGIETNIGIEISYSHPFTPIPYQVPIFPLPIVYSILFFILFCVSYISTMYVHIKGLIGYIGLISMGSLYLIFENYSGKYDVFNDYLHINLMQIFSIFIIIFCAYRLNMIYNGRKTKEYVLSN